MAELVTSESRRYLHGFQRNINEVSELQHIVPVDNQVTYIDSFTNYGFDTVYGDEYVISASEGNDPRIQEALNLATTVQAAIDELDSEKGGLAQDNTWAGSNTFTQALTALQFVKSGGTSGQFLKADGSVDSSSYEPTITAGTTSQYYRGDKTWQTLDTAAVTESTNLYFTNARVLGTVLTGLNTSLTGAVVASDTILAAIGKLENRVAGFSAAGVSSFNTRTGAVTLTSGDVTGALGFAPSPDTHTHPASSITNTPVAPITSANVQGALNEVASLANSASSAASSAQTAANNAQTAANAANSAAAYADRLARSGHNLIKNGNSEDPNPIGYEAAGVYDTTYDSYKAFTGSKVRRTVTDSTRGAWFYLTGEIPCAPGDQHAIEAMVLNISAVGLAYVGIRYMGPSGLTGLGTIGASGTTNAWTRTKCSGTAPAGTTSVSFYIEHYAAGGAGALAYYDCLYACRKVSAGMLEADAIQSTTSNFSVKSATASTSTSTGSIVASGGIGCADYFTGKYRSSDGSAGLTATRTFYAASSSGGATNVLNTVTIKDGIITSWTQA